LVNREKGPASCGVGECCTTALWEQTGIGRGGRGGGRYRRGSGPAPADRRAVLDRWRIA